MESVKAEMPAEEPSAVRQTANTAAGEASSVASTVADQTRQVAQEAKTQARSVAGDVRDRVADQARTQNDKLADGLRQISGELEKMAAGHEDSPARTVVMRIADSGHQAADYLAQHGPEGVLAEVHDFARRRPGAFLAAAVATGFVVGRLGRGVIEAGNDKAPSRSYEGVPSSATTLAMPTTATTVVSTPVAEDRL